MKNKSLKHTFEKYIHLSVLIFVVSNLIFTRSFVGLEIFGFRLGEYIVLIGFLHLTFLSIKFLKYKKSSEYILFSYIYFYFLIQVLFTGAEFLNSYVYKSASFIGMISFYFIGLKFPQKYLYSNRLYKSLFLLTPIIYMFGSSKYPKFISDFFIQYSDKFEYIKASDVLMALVIVVFIYNNSGKDNLIYIATFVFIPLFLPILLYLSRGSFVALLVFLIMEIFALRKQLILNKVKTLIFTFVAVIIFIISTFNIYGNLSFEKNNSLLNEGLKITQNQVLQENLEDLLNRRNYIGVIFSLYFDDGVLKSTDGTLNWRLDIWQDLLKDQNQKNKLIFGYGYNEILPVMADPSEPGRWGGDGLNENIHNYFLNIFARGGVPLFLLFIFLHVSFLTKWRERNKNLRLLNFIAPLLIASFFDVSMEGVQFPFNYYFFIGIFLAKKN